MRVLAVRPRNTGYTHIVMDAAVDKRVTIVTLSEAAHELLGLRPDEWMDTMVYQWPRRRTELTG